MGNNEKPIGVLYESEYCDWLKDKLTKNSYSKYRSYLRKCIRSLERKTEDNELVFDLQSIINDYFNCSNNADVDALFVGLNVANQLLSDDSSITDDDRTGFSKYVEFLLSLSKQLPNQWKKKQVFIIFVNEYRKKLDERYNTDERFPNFGGWCPIKILSPLFNSDPILSNEFRNLKESIKNHFLVITERGIARLTAINAFYAVQTGSNFQLYASVKQCGIIKVYYMHKQQIHLYTTKQHTWKDIVTEMSREHFIPISLSLSLPELKALNEVRYILQRNNICCYNDWKKQTQQVKNYVKNQIKKVGLGYILSDLKLIESLMTYTLIPQTYNSSQGNGKRKKNKLEENKNQQNLPLWTGDIITPEEMARIRVSDGYPPYPNLEGNNE